AAAPPTYVWHPSTSAHEVHGAIQALYLALGGSRATTRRAACSTISSATWAPETAGTSATDRARSRCRGGRGQAPPSRGIDRPKPSSSAPCATLRRPAPANLLPGRAIAAPLKPLCFARPRGCNGTGNRV
ncbi:MAG: hypothetical protein JNL68_15540, partial [Burkholderiales bacterium]|nr:hypothetical protein [Burkholderiales bacterium]